MIVLFFLFGLLLYRSLTIISIISGGGGVGVIFSSLSGILPLLEPRSVDWSWCWVVCIGSLLLFRGTRSYLNGFASIVLSLKMGSRWGLAIDFPAIVICPSLIHLFGVYPVLPTRRCAENSLVPCGIDRSCSYPDCHLPDTLHFLTTQPATVCSLCH